MANYLFIPKTTVHYVTTPDQAAFDVTDLDVRVRVRLDDYSPASNTWLIQRWGATTSVQQFIFELTTTGFLVLFWRTASATLSKTVANPGTLDGNIYWLRATLDVNNGAGDAEVKFYWSSTDTLDHAAVAWTQVGVTQLVGATTSIQAITGPLLMGRNAAGTHGTFGGDAFRGVMLDGIGGSPVAHFSADDFDVGDSDTDTAVDATGKTWTIFGADSEVFSDSEAFSGGSEATVTVDAEGGGYKTGLGGSETEVRVAAAGAGFKQGQGGAESLIAVAAAGAGFKHAFGGSSAVVSVAASGGGFEGQLGTYQEGALSVGIQEGALSVGGVQQ